MHPISLDLARTRIGLVGRGFRALRRLALLDAESASDIAVFSDKPSPELAERAGARLLPRLPLLDDLRHLQVLFVADLEAKESRLLALRAQRLGLIINVEDEPALSNFHSAAQIRRGDLTIAVSTNGTSPALASLLRQHIEGLLGPEWERQAAEAARRRQQLKREGATSEVILAETRALLGLPPAKPKLAPPANDNRAHEPHHPSLRQSPVKRHARVSDDA